MKHLIVVLAMATFGAAPAAGQAWTPQIGFVGGLARIKPAGTGQPDDIDRLELPGTGSSYPTLFAIIPLTSRLALEPAIAASHAGFKEASGLIPSASSSNVRLTLRVDVALASRFYAAAGGLIRYKQSDALHAMQPAALVALGYHHDLGSDLTARIEAQWISQRRTDSILPANVYAFLLGFSRRLVGSSPRPTPPGDSSSARARPWRLGLGVAGGYVRTHLYGNTLGFHVDAHETLVDLPGSGSTTPPALSVIVPLRGRVALETGFDAQRTEQQGSTLFDGQLSTRLNLAIYRGWYVAGGGNIHYVEQNTISGFAFAGANVAAGYRFPLLEELDGRVEFSFTAFKERRDFPFAQNTLALLLGVTMALE
jgi:hypothetical protein